VIRCERRKPASQVRKDRAVVALACQVRASNAREILHGNGVTNLRLRQDYAYQGGTQLARDQRQADGRATH
jgi:hypothetical protein